MLKLKEALKRREQGIEDHGGLKQLVDLDDIEEQERLPSRPLLGPERFAGKAVDAPKNESQTKTVAGD